MRPRGSRGNTLEERSRRAVIEILTARAGAVEVMLLAGGMAHDDVAQPVPTNSAFGNISMYVPSLPSSPWASDMREDVEPNPGMNSFGSSPISSSRPAMTHDVPADRSRPEPLRGPAVPIGWRVDSVDNVAMGKSKPESRRSEIISRLLNFAWWAYLFLSDTMRTIAMGPAETGDLGPTWLSMFFSWNRSLGDMPALTKDFFTWLPVALLTDWCIRREARKSREGTTSA